MSPRTNCGGAFPRTLRNLAAAALQLPHVWVFDNDDLRTPFRLVAVFETGQPVRLNPPSPEWLRPMLPRTHRDRRR